MSVTEFVNTIARSLEDLWFKGIIPQTTPLDFKIHDIHNPWALVQTWKEQSSAAQGEGPVQVLLTAEAAIGAKEPGWIHGSRIQGQEPEEGTRTSKPGDTKGTLKRNWGLMRWENPNDPRDTPRTTPDWETRPSLYQWFQVLPGQVLRHL